MTRPFFETLRELRRGQTLAELGDKLSQLTQAVCATGKAGKLTLTLTLAPAGKRGTALLLADKVTLTEPQPDQANTIFYPTADYQLSRNDPNQMTFNLKPVPNVDENGEIIQDPADLERAQRDM